MRNLAFAGFVGQPGIIDVDTVGSRQSIIGIDTVVGRQGIIGVDTVANRQGIVGVDVVIAPKSTDGREAALLATAQFQRQQIDALANHIIGAPLSAKDGFILDLTIGG